MSRIKLSKKFKVTVFLFIVVSSIVVALMVLQGEKEEVILTGNTLEPERFERTIRITEFTSLNIQEKFDEHLYNPMQIKLFQNNLYVADYGDMKIKRFSEDGELLSVIGKGRGKGPGELLHIVDFIVDENNKIWVLDGSQLTANCFGIDGNYIDSFTLKFNPLRIIVADDDFIILGIGNDYLFKRVDRKGKILNEFGNLIENQMQNPLSLDGWIVNISNHRFIYVPIYASLIYIYGPNNSLQKVSRRPDGLNFAGTINRSTEDRAFYMAPSASIEGEYVSKDNSHLYINEYYEPGNEADQRSVSLQPLSKARATIDKYDLNTGKYLYSMNPPFAFKIFQIDGDTLFVNQEGKIKAYKF